MQPMDWLTQPQLQTAEQAHQLRRRREPTCKFQAWNFQYLPAVSSCGRVQWQQFLRDGFFAMVQMERQIYKIVLLLARVICTHPAHRGGSKDAIVVTHTHTATVTDPGHNHTGYNTPYPNAGIPGGGNPGTVFAGNTGTATTGISVGISTVGSSGTDANLPPYYALAFIMKS
jgi:hypothetical protein